MEIQKKTQFIYFTIHFMKVNIRLVYLEIFPGISPFDKLFSLKPKNPI